MFQIKKSAIYITTDEKFNNYTTTVDLDENYLKKTYTEAVDEIFKNYPTNKYIDDNFATKTELNNVDTKLDNYTTTTDLESNYAKIIDLDDYMKKDDIIPTNSEFDVIKGYDYFTVVHSDLTHTLLTISFLNLIFKKSRFLKN